ncbi:KxYKxGKxW signal peptide domain-containing protein [Paucilactobacillus sp. N302-9]
MGKNNYKYQKLVQDSATVKSRYKLYKSGRNWVVAGIVSATLLFTTPTVLDKVSAVHADELTDPAQTSSSAPASDSSSASEATLKPSADSQATKTDDANNATADKTSDSATATPATTTPQKKVQVDAESTSTISSPTAKVTDTSLLAGIDQLKLDVTGTYADNADIKAGSKIAIRFTNPSSLKLDSFADTQGASDQNVPTYLTRVVDAANGVIYYVYNTDITQAGSLGFSLSIPTVSAGQSNVVTTLQDPNGKTIINFDTPESTVTIVDPETSGSTMVIFPTDQGELNQATKIKGTNTPINDETDRPGGDVKGNLLNISAPGEYLPDGNLIPVTSELRLKDWQDGDKYMNTATLENMQANVAADGTVDLPGLSSFNDNTGTVAGGWSSEPFIGVIKTSGQLSYVENSFKVTDKEAGTDLTDTFVVYKISDGLYGFTLNPDTTDSQGFSPAWSPTIKHDFVFTYDLQAASVNLDPSVDTASEQMYWVTLPASTADSIGFLGDNTTFDLTYNQSPSSTKFKPRISGLSDRNFPTGVALTNADLLTNVTANDVEDKDLTSKLVITDLGGLDLDSPALGDYTISVQVTDSDKNTTYGTEKISIKNPEYFNVTYIYYNDDTKTVMSQTDPEKEMLSTLVQKNAELPGYTLVSVDGADPYKDANGKLIGATVLWNQDRTVTFHYTSNPATAIVNYVDQDNDGAIVATETLPGKTGDAIPFDTAAYIAKTAGTENDLTNYEIVTDETTTPTNFDTTDDGTTVSQTFKVVLKHKHKTVPSTDPDALTTNYVVNYTVNGCKLIPETTFKRAYNE